MSVATAILVSLVAIAVAFLGGYLIASMREGSQGADAADAERHRAEKDAEDLSDGQAWGRFYDEYGP